MRVRRLAPVVIGLLLALLLPARQAPAQVAGAVPSELRSCSCAINNGAVRTALDLKHAGWTYVMPSPKSRQAAWGNYDRRTTWWPGYWSNARTGAVSESQPYKGDRGQWLGDGRGGRAYYRNGASPRPPTEIEWLCSTEGGILPR